MTTIYTRDFQPFESRRGRDTVVGLHFNYDPQLIDLLKRTLRQLKDQAVDPSRHIFQPGGWRPEEKCWFIERSIWGEVKHILEYEGYCFQPMEGTDK